MVKPCQTGQNEQLRKVDSWLEKVDKFNLPEAQLSWREGGPRPPPCSALPHFCETRTCNTLSYLGSMPPNLDGRVSLRRREACGRTRKGAWFELGGKRAARFARRRGALEDLEELEEELEEEEEERN